MSKRKARKRKKRIKRVEGSEEIAVKVAKDFKALDLDAKDKFVHATLKAIIKYIGKPKVRKKVFKTMMNPKRGLKKESIETLNQLILAFLWSIKPNFRYQWQETVFKFLGVPEAQVYAEQAARRAEELQNMGLRFVYLGLTPDGYEKIDKMLQEIGGKPLDDLTII